MSNLSNQTGSINIQQPEHWTLLLALRSEKLCYALFSPRQDNSLIAGELAIDASSGYLTSLENVVYDNPVLLDDYGTVRILVDVPHFSLLPPDVVDEQQAEDLLRVMYAQVDVDVVLSAMPHCGVGLAFDVPADVLAFMQRTFNMAPVYHHLQPLCEHYARFCKTSSVSRMFLNFHDNRMDMVVFKQSSLQMINSFEVRNANDASFMALHAWESLAMDVHSDELQLTGDKAIRDEVTQHLRQYVSYVMPAIFPVAAMRLSHDAQLVPFDLVTLALCE